MNQLSLLLFQKGFFGDMLRGWDLEFLKWNCRIRHALSFAGTIYTPEDLKWHEFNKLKLYTTIEPDTKNVKLFIIINSFGIFLFSKSDLFINNNDVEHK